MANSNDNRPRQSSAALGIRALVLLYILYMAYNIVAAYLRGDSDALSLPMTILTSAILVLLSVVLLVLTYRQWKAQFDRSDSHPSSDSTDEPIL